MHLWTQIILKKTIIMSSSMKKIINTWVPQEIWLLLLYSLIILFRMFFYFVFKKISTVSHMPDLNPQKFWPTQWYLFWKIYTKKGQFFFNQHKPNVLYIKLKNFFSLVSLAVTKIYGYKRFLDFVFFFGNEIH